MTVAAAGCNGWFNDEWLRLNQHQRGPVDAKVEPPQLLPQPRQTGGVGSLTEGCQLLLFVLCSVVFYAGLACCLRPGSGVVCAQSRAGHCLCLCQSPSIAGPGSVPGRSRPLPDGWCRQAFKYRLEPDQSTEVLIRRHCGMRRFAHNWAIAQMRDQHNMWSRRVRASMEPLELRPS